MRRPSTHQLFAVIVRHPWWVLVAGLTLLLPFVWLATTLEKNTSPDAFISSDDPALRYSDKVTETFGLDDPIVVAVVHDGQKGIYTPQTLNLVRQLTDRIQDLPNVDPDRVTSLATEKRVVGTRDGVVIERFFAEEAESFADPMGSVERAEEIRKAVNDMPSYRGNLVARDGLATAIVVELLDPAVASESYNRVRQVVEEVGTVPGARVYVAGQAAVAGHLSAYIDQDVRQLIPLTVVTVGLVLLAAFASLRGLVIPKLGVAATLIITLGIMGVSGADFYVITNGLLVNLIGIAVADEIHIFTRYQKERCTNPEGARAEAIIAAMTHMARPISLTTVTTVGGFLALAAASEIPPVRDFGVYGAIGVAVAWLYTLTLTPAALALWPERKKPRRIVASNDRVAELLQKTGTCVTGRPRTVCLAAVAFCGLGVLAATQIEVEEEWINNFDPASPIHQADRAINAHLDGTYYLDIVVDSGHPDGLYAPGVLQRIADLQTFLTGLPHINGTTSIVDDIKQMHRAVNANAPEAYRIPDHENLVAQLLLLRQTSADPTELQERIDARRQQALVRAHLDTGKYSIYKYIVPEVEEYIRNTFDDRDLSATLTGQAKIDYLWMTKIAENHASSVTLAGLAVFAVAALVFRSLAMAAVTMIPVAMAVLFVYALMGASGIWFGVGTSMFAAIAIGLSIDFAVHAVDRIRTTISDKGLHESLRDFYSETARALLFNFLAVGLGFAVLLASQAPPLVAFGALVVSAVAGALLAAVTVLPAAINLLQPRALTRAAAGRASPKTTSSRSRPK